MNATRQAGLPECSREQVREAAVWMTLLRSPQRTEKVERGFKRWLAAEPGHAAAFEKASTAWEISGAFPRGPLPNLTRWQRAGFRQGFRHAIAATAAVAVLALVGIVLYGNSAGVATDVGEQRILTLQDGTRVFLNTDTRLVVNYDERRRAIELKTGEAFFDVATKGPEWPFVVIVDGKRVNAMGTSFVVRRDPRRVSVTLLEGKVMVLPDRDASAAIPLSPGQRLTFAAKRPPAVDEPSIEKVTAWRSGYVDLAVMPLADAIAEMNRYSRVKVAVSDPESSAIPVSGVFRAGDTGSFANAVAESYGLQVDVGAERIVLNGKPMKGIANKN